MISVFDLFKIGIGPSSSHTVGPMKAANAFLAILLSSPSTLSAVMRIKVELFGSLGATGRGHGSDVAVMLGLLGERPDCTDTQTVAGKMDRVHELKRLVLNQAQSDSTSNSSCQSIEFIAERDLVLYQNKSLPYHPNAMTLSAFDEQGHILLEKTYYSVGGGFIVDDVDKDQTSENQALGTSALKVPYAFRFGEELLDICAREQLSISEVVLQNEMALSGESQSAIFARLQPIWQVMQDCVVAGCQHDGILPGGLNVKRRAAALYQTLIKEKQQRDQQQTTAIPLYEMDWVNLYALAVNEENAAGGRVVTAPTNGAAGIIPAVLHYFRDFSGSYNDEKAYRFLLAAAAIGMIIKENASISGAEVGCQGEVGSACAMAAAGLTEVLGGSPAQCTNAAEIGIEHNLGLTCDPIAGLVQIPCIERNAMASVKAINATQMARRGDGTHVVSLDKAIKTMRDTGKDMMDKYKETAQGGLAVNVIEVPVNFVDC